MNLTDRKQLKASLAAEIIKTLDREGLTVRGAAEITGIAAADFSRIRKVDLDRFTVDRLMTIVHRLGGRVEVSVKVKRAPAEARTWRGTVQLILFRVLTPETVSTSPSASSAAVRV